MPASKISLARYEAILGESFEQLQQLYHEDFSNGAQSGLVRAFGDHRYLLSARVLGAASAKAARPTWLYYVDYGPQSQTGTWPGTPHGMDAYLLFAFADNSDSVTLALVERMRAYWSNFAASGNPNGDGLAPWPDYHPSSDAWLVFGAQDETRAGVLRAKLDLLEAH
jgi:para-nitrobenzyl esterase